MPKLQNPIEIEVWNTGRVLRFTTAKALKDWAKQESQAWPAAREPIDAQLRNHWNIQVSTFAALLNAAETLEPQLRGPPSPEHVAAEAAYLASTRKMWDRVRNGAVITTDHRHFDDIKALTEADPNGATLLLIASLSNGAPTLQTMLNANVFPLGSLVRSALSTRPTVESEALNVNRTHLQGLIGDMEAEVARAQGVSEMWEETFRLTNEAGAGENSSRSGEWTERLEAINAQWTSALKTYDEKMALAAPTTYWRKRATASLITAIVFGIGFASLIGVALYQFQLHAIPYLATVTKPGVPILSAVLPVIIPGFAAVWILRIVGRLLSENIQLMQDATERETMVKTFLALMHDEVRGKTLVTDDDRLLILHALFRPSAISGTDDAPPVNWFDILSRKFGGPQKP